jgi:GAF domain-containing protein
MQDDAWPGVTPGRAAAPLAEIHRVLAIADIAHVINDFRPLDETLDEICQRVAATVGYDFTALTLPDADGSSLLIRGSANLSPRYVRHVNHERPLQLEPRAGHRLSPTAHAFRSGMPVALDDVELDPGFEPWRQAARLQGYRSLVCVPIVVRSHVIGVLDCYRSQPHRHRGEELQLLQLVARLAGVAIETAQLADSQRRAVDDLRALTERLRRQNQELSWLNLAQARLTEDLAAVDATAVERTAGALASLASVGVLVSGAEGRVIAYAGPPESREPMAVVGARAQVRRRLQREPSVWAGGCSCFRLGATEQPLGVLVLCPELADEAGVEALAARHAAAVISAELQSERADRALEAHARPAVLLALTTGVLSRPQLLEAAGVLGIPADAPLRLAVIGCASPEAAHRLSRRWRHLAADGWEVTTASASGGDCVVLLRAGEPERLRRAAAAVRQRLRLERIGISAELRGLEAVPAGVRQARAAAAADLGGILLYEDLGPLGALAQGLAPASIRATVEEVLGRVRDHDRRRGTELIPTLRAYVQHDGRVSKAARSLRVHPNTFHQRLRRASEIGRFDLRDYRQLARVVLTLDWDWLLALEPPPAGPA